MNTAHILENFSILYVEDEQDVRDELAQFLKRRTKNLHLASNGREGLAAFETLRPDIVITDILMPEMDGLSMAKEIKRLSPETPIIITTAFNEADLFLKAIEIGIEKYVLKPIQPAKLLVSLTESAWLLKALKDLRLSATVFDASSEAILVTDPDNVIMAVNPAFKKITGYEDEDVLGKNPKILSSGQQDKSFYQKMWQSIKELGHWEGEIWNRRKNGEFFPEWLTITVVRDENQELIYHVALFSDITSRKQNEQRLYRLAHYDALTELPNRILLEDRLEQAILQAQAQKNIAVSVLFIDLDRFKVVNDTLGHYVGDILLQHVAGRMQACVRGTDTVARLGGDEFVVVLSNMEHGEDAAGVARKIINSISTPFQIQSNDLSIGCSIGISVYPHNGDNAQTLMKHADTAMYRVKEAGKNDYQFFHHDMNVRLFERLTMENSLRLAIQKNELELYYQPVFDMEKNSVSAVEALLRWNHPTLGLILPDRFLPLAEEVGLMVALGDWILNTATAQIKPLQDNGFPNLRLAINLSAHQLKIPGLLRSVTSILEKQNYNPQLLEFEIKESTLLHYNSDMIAVLNQLKNTGGRRCA